jgi:hypothetical protein
VIIGVIVVFVLRAIQPDWPKADSNDAPYFEALGWSLAERGGAAHPGYVGGNIWGYHFLAYLWTGVLGKLTNAEPFSMLNLFLPFLQGLSCSLLLIDEKRQLVGDRIFEVVRAFLFIFITRQTSFTSLDLSTWGITALVVMQLSLARSETTTFRHRIASEVCLATLGSIVVLAKGTSLPVVLTLSMAIMVLKAQQQRHLGGKHWFQFIPWHLGGVGLVATTWYLPLSGSALVLQAERSVLNTVLTFGLNDGLWQSRDVLERIPILLLCSAFGFVSLRKSQDATERLILKAIGIVGTSVTALLIVLPELNARRYVAIHAFVVIVILFVALSGVSGTAKVVFRFPKFVWIATVITLICFSLFEIYFLGNFVKHLASHHTNRWLTLAVSLSTLPMALLIPLTLFLISLCLISPFKVRQNEVKEPNGTVVAIALSFILGLAIWHSINRVDQVVYYELSTKTSIEANFSAAFPDSDTQDAGHWIRENTPKSSIIASNSFCCIGTNWLSESLNQITSIDDKFQQYKNQESAYGGANFLLVSVSRRQFLLAGPRFVVPISEDLSKVSQWLRWSVEFPYTTVSTLDRDLRLAGVDYFVIDKLALDLRARPKNSPDSVFENQRYMIVKLKGIAD